MGHHGTFEQLHNGPNGIGKLVDIDAVIVRVDVMARRHRDAVTARPNPHHEAPAVEDGAPASRIQPGLGALYVRPASVVSEEADRRASGPGTRSPHASIYCLS